MSFRVPLGALLLIRWTDVASGITADTSVAHDGHHEMIRSFMTRAQQLNVADDPETVASSSLFYRASGPLFILTLFLAWFTRPKVSEPLPPGFGLHVRRYLLVWCLAVGADWLQGPYVYELYVAYGYSSEQIAHLFLYGFAASMVFGVVVGSLADRWGRKRCAILYCALYIASCLTKHVNMYWVLVVGRLTGGIATSLLFTTFECWMVAEHCYRLKFSDTLLRYMFGLMFFCMYAVAIVCGVISQYCVDAMPMQLVPGSSRIHFGGYTTAFDLSIVLLVACIIAVCPTWEENYGTKSDALVADKAELTSFKDSMINAGRLMLSNPSIALLCTVVSCFEGSMYAFVFNWTPALHSLSIPLPHGHVFSLFMMACMCGASVFSMTDPGIKPSKVLVATFLLASLSLGAVSYSLSKSVLPAMIFYGFLVFEFCVGVYFPAIGTVKSSVVPEASRAGVYNAFRVPLNAVLCGLLLGNLALTTCFALCSSFLCISLVCMAMFIQVEPGGVDSLMKSEIQ